MIGGAQTAEAWKTVTNMKGNQKNKNIDHFISTKVWSRHYQKLLTKNRKTKKKQTTGIMEMLHPPLISNDEAKRALHKMKIWMEKRLSSSNL